MGAIMNLVVITAAVSSMNGGLYATGASKRPGRPHSRLVPPSYY
jgi:L-asparagine transporter-like permease